MTTAGFWQCVRGFPPESNLMVTSAHEEHPAHDVRGAHPFRSRNGAVLAQPLRRLIHVLAVHNARVVAVHDVVNLVRLDDVLQVLVVHDVGAVRHHLIHEATATHARHPLFITHHRGPLAHCDALRVIHAHDEHIAQGPTLAERVHVAIMHHVEGAVHPDPHRFPLPHCTRLGALFPRILQLGNGHRARGAAAQQQRRKQRGGHATHQDAHGHAGQEAFALRNQRNHLFASPPSAPSANTLNTKWHSLQ
eukprot:scaffold1617_cov252-Pinguiococcus_pyrenoidosus.AAC.13